MASLAFQALVKTEKTRISLFVLPRLPKWTEKTRISHVEPRSGEDVEPRSGEDAESRSGEDAKPRSGEDVEFWTLARDSAKNRVSDFSIYIQSPLYVRRPLYMRTRAKLWLIMKKMCYFFRFSSI